MPKRPPSSDLNQDNWNNEEEPEESGQFVRASKEDMSKRVFKTGVRRLPQKNSNGEKPSLFAGFGGFGIPSSKADKPFSNLFQKEEPKKEDNKKEVTEKDEKQSTYLSKLKGLNETFLENVKTHVGKNPMCILTPMFADYDKYLKEIKAERDLAQKDAKPSEPAVTNFSNFKFSKLPTATNEGKSDLATDAKKEPPNGSQLDKEKPPFSFGMTLPSNSSNPLLTSNFGATTESGKTDSFRFPFVNNFSAGNPSTTDSESKKEEGEEGEEVEKYDFVPVVEDEALYSQRVKMFVKKQDSYVDKGVGMLYIKNVSGKHQALIRADTSLGNILMNIILNEDIPSERVGKNNVTLVCIPTPDSTPPPVPVLLRVKTGEEADNLLLNINKYKKNEGTNGD